MLSPDRRPRLFAALAAAAALCSAIPAFAAQITDVRVGVHPKFTRIVFELDGRAGYRVERTGSELKITIEATSSARSLRASGDVRGVKVDAGTQARAHVALRDSGLRVREMILSDPPRIVIDVVKSETAVAAATAPRPAPKTEAKPSPSPAPKPVAEAKPSPSPAPKPVAEAKPSPSPAPKSVAEAKPSPSPAPKPVAEAKPSPSPAPKPIAEAKPSPSPAPKPAETKPAPEPPKPIAEVKPSPSPAPAQVELTPPAPPAVIPAPRATESAPAISPAPSASPALTTPPDVAKLPPAPLSPAPVPPAPPAATLPSPMPPAPVAPKPAPTMPAPAPPAAPSSWSDRLGDPLWLGGIAAAVLGLAAIAVVLRRRRALPNDLDVTAIAEEIEQTSDAGSGRIPSGGFAMGDDAASAPESSFGGLFDQPISAAPVLAPAPAPARPAPSPIAMPMPTPAAAEAEDSLFDEPGELTAEPEPASESSGDAAMDTEMDLPVDRHMSPPTARMGGSAAPSAAPSPDMTRMFQELERRMATLEARLDEANEAREKLERQVAAQSEELRVQRAAIARTQRALRTMTRGDEDKATEPALRDGETQAKTRVTP